MRVPVPLSLLARETSVAKHSREQHLAEFTELLDAALATGKPMILAYLGATGDDPAHGAVRFRGLEERLHVEALSVAMIAATRSGSVSRDGLIGLFANLLHEMDAAGWPEPRS